MEQSPVLHVELDKIQLAQDQKMNMNVSSVSFEFQSHNLKEFYKFISKIIISVHIYDISLDYRLTVQGWGNLGAAEYPPNSENKSQGYIFSILSFPTA